MSSMEDKLSKLREERMARERARIEKLRELNLKKYNKNDLQEQKSSTSSVSIPIPKSKSDLSCPTRNNMNGVKKSYHVNGTSKRPMSAIPKKPINYVTANKNIASVKSSIAAKNVTNAINGKKDKPVNLKESKVNKTDDDKITNDRKHNPLREIVIGNDAKDISKIPKVIVTKDGDPNKFKSEQKMHKSMAVGNKKSNLNNKAANSQPANTNSKRESVFDRLYKPKVLPKVIIDNALKLQTDPNYFKKVIKDSKMLMTRRQTVFEPKAIVPVRRSISAVHLKKISKNELSNCVHKWASIGEKIDNVHLKDINEDDYMTNERIVSAVKSERKKVKFQTPSNFNTPRPEELQSRLHSWLQKRGKSLESYHHLQCFGMHHLAKDIKPLNLEIFKYGANDDENKENVALEHDSDNESFHENMNIENDDVAADNKVEFPVDKWRRASYFSDSVDLNDSRETTLTSCGTTHHVDELLVGVLNDLTELLREGFEWEQCARWLRVVRERFPRAPDTAPYWECRAALEERRGDLPASLQCWEQAVANGTEHSVVEANLDNLLDKFMQLKISPTSGKRQVDPKLVDVKSVFKSTIIRFGVQQAKLRQSNETVRYTVTPVRRSSRLSVYRHTPLRVCATLREASELGPIEFVPNKALNKTP